MVYIVYKATKLNRSWRTFSGISRQAITVRWFYRCDHIFEFDYVNMPLQAFSDIYAADDIQLRLGYLVIY